MKKAMSFFVLLFVTAVLSLAVVGCKSQDKDHDDHPHADHPKGEHPK